MIDSADVVVIGAGALGASVTYHLAKAGAGDVVLLDKSQPVSQTSSHAAGLSSQVQPTPFLTRMATQSVRAVERFEQDTGESLAFHQPGSLRLALTDEYARRLRYDVEHARALGVVVDLIEHDAIERLAPWVVTGPVAAASYTPTDVYFEPGALPRAYVRAAQRLGALVVPDTRVTGIDASGGKVAGVTTDRGTIASPVVVDTAGAWSVLVGDMANISIALAPLRHQLMITRPLDFVEPTHSIVRVMDVNVYVRPCDGGLMLGGYEPDPMVFDGHTMSAQADVGDLSLDVSVLRALADRVVDVMPAFDGVELAEHRGGLPTMTVDGNPLLGPLPGAGLEGFYILSGCCVGGLGKSPALGAALARWIVDGEPGEDLSDAAPGRFDGRFDNPDELVEACRWQYAHHYHKSSPTDGD
ncbi:MAG: FAD-binding oxidoreductase [Phycisphaeraceae bacterium]|nr:FAD-binding oxidoreductase [Phycisphaeraceae bacterium]